jgi:hypothetical protein
MKSSCKESNNADEGFVVTAGRMSDGLVIQMAKISGSCLILPCREDCSLLAMLGVS